MKKLLISIVATASLALVAKAGVEPLNATSFETLESGKITAENIGAFLSEDGYRYWTGYTDDSDLTVTALEKGAKGDVARPKYWADEDDAKALAIDVDTPLARNITTAEGAGVPREDIGDGLYFDSMVQFTATEDVPEVTDGDKLIVWLKEDAPTTEDGDPTYSLYVTAGVKVEGVINPTPYKVTNATVAPDSWHRLTIAINKTGDTPTFKVYVDGVAVTYLDGEEVKSCENNLFGSLCAAGKNGAGTITSVSFKGKGAIDDLVWTTEDPFVAPTVKVEVTWTGYQSDDFVPAWGLPNDEDSASEEFPVEATIGQTIRFACNLPDGYSVKYGEESFIKGEAFGGNWYYDVEITSGLTSLTFTITQDAKPVAQIGATTYTSLTDALAAAQADEIIKLLANIETDAAVEITKAVVIDLNGTTIKASQNDTEGNGVFWVKKGGVLTIGGNGTVNGNGGSDYKMAIWADEGTVVINGGSYVNTGAGTHNQYDLIYVKNGGTVEINDGTFECKTPRWTLNSHNSLAGTFVVKGGKFYGYDPSKINTDEPTVTSWCPAGYEAKVDGNGYYVVTEKKVETVKPGASVAVDSEEDAKAVEIEVDVPTGVDITEEAYKAYFKKSIELNPETGKYEVSAVLNEEVVTPVIEATTGKDGAVTPAISFDSDGKVTINISNELRGLFYGVKYATTVGGVETAAAIPGLTVTPKAGGTAGFFRVVVDFKEIPEPAAK